MPSPSCQFSPCLPKLSQARSHSPGRPFTHPIICIRTAMVSAIHLQSAPSTFLYIDTAQLNSHPVMISNGSQSV
jgi:hypothetical protein